MDEHDPLARFRMKQCVCCGYDLRLLDSTMCPECGLNVRGALVFSGSSWVRFGAILFTAVAALALFKDIAQLRIALRHLLPDVGFVLAAAICWMQAPRRGIARDGSAMIVTEAGALHPRMLWVKVISWEWIDAIDIESIRGGRPSDDPLVAKKFLLAVHLVPPPRAARGWRDFINVFSIQVIRTPLFANEAELHALRHALAHLEATGRGLNANIT